MEWIAGNPRPMSSCGPFALGSLSFWTRCNHPHRRLPFRGVSCDLGGFQIWLCTKTSPPKQVVYHHFAFSNGLLEGSQFSDTHTHTISILHVTYLRLPMIIYRCLHICTVHVRFGICVPGSSSSVQNDQASSEIGLRIWAPKLQPPGAAAEMV